MAEATISTKTVERIIRVPEDEVTLTLSKEEAKYVVALLGKVGGDGDGVRKIGTNIRTALISAVGKWYFRRNAIKSPSALRFNEGFHADNSFTTDVFEA